MPSQADNAAYSHDYDRRRYALAPESGTASERPTDVAGAGADRAAGRSGDPVRIATAATVPERKYQMTRLGAGDYLLPSNNAKTLWRLAQGEDLDGSKPWHLFRWNRGFPTNEQLSEAFEEGDWASLRWEHYSGPFRTRAQVIEEALRSV